MKERQSRLKAIKNLIKNNTIESQDDLQSLLLKEGYDVTQATLSRDLKLLKVAGRTKRVHVCSSRRRRKC